MHTPDPIIEIENIAKKADIKLIHYRDSVLHRFPLLFSFLAISGFTFEFLITISDDFFFIKSKFT